MSKGRINYLSGTAHLETIAKTQQIDMNHIMTVLNELMMVV